MILTKDININKYRVLADYKVKVSKSPFMSVLQLAKDEGGMLNPEVLYEKLMKPLALKACENLLERLTLMGYFDIINENNDRFSVQVNAYELTDFGLQSIDNKDFYDKRNGLLEIWVAKNNMFTQRIVKIDELKYDDDKKNKTENIDDNLRSLVNYKNVIKLNNGAFTLDKIEEQIKFLKEDTEELRIVLEESNYKIQLASFFEDIKEEKQKVIASILESEFDTNYLPKEHIVMTHFNNNDLSLVRNHKIERPFYKETYFNAITIPNIAVSPKTIEDAREWFERLLKKRVSKYFLSDEEYNEFENKLAIEFQLYKETLVNSISRQQLIEMFGEEDFYKKAKLETIDYLNY